MSLKHIALILIIISVLFAGCAEKEETVQETPGEEVSTPEQAPVEEEDQAEIPVGEGIEHIVRLENYNVVNPAALEIQKGDTVSWWSHKRQGNFVLVSEDGLFQPEKLLYRVYFKYTFTNPGTYLFTVEDVPEMNLTVTVT